jgi:hypothetical protein
MTALHWVADVAFREDVSRKRKDNAPENLAVVRHIALSLLRAEKALKRSIAGKRLAAGYLETVLSKALWPNTGLSRTDRLQLTSSKGCRHTHRD